MASVTRAASFWSWRQCSGVRCRFQDQTCQLPGRLLHWSKQHPLKSVSQRYASKAAGLGSELPPHLQAIVDDYDRRQAEAEASRHWLMRLVASNRYAVFFGMGFAGLVGGTLYLFDDAGSDVHQVSGWFFRRLSPETARKVFMWAAFLRLLPSDYDKDDHYCTVEPVDGMVFTTPVGLAAGLDLEARAPNAFFHLGFGSLDVGPVDPARVHVIRDRLAARDRMSQVVNLGRVGVSLAASSGQEVVNLIEELGDHVDFFVLDVSTVPTCEQGQEDALRSLAKQAVEAASECSPSSGGNAPLVFLRIPTDWPKAAVSATARREAVVGAGTAAVAGGAAGLLICAGSSASESSVSTLVQRVADVYAATNGRAIIVTSGGVEAGREVLECIEAGASIVEISPLVLLTEGPGACRRIKNELSHFVMLGGYVRLKEAIGASHRRRTPVKGGARKQNRWKAKAGSPTAA
mmetsp:Transcript_162392/g.299585  ORF Transcript_162392/g.299585 Transcript_162392/m.299585 type:complete len:462 (+) Transcript_162392:33-1418(+)